MACILVTGGAGFIGSNLCRALLAHGHTVFAVDNLITGHKSNIAPYLEDPHFSFYELDIADPAFVTLFSEKRVDYVYHLACPTGVPNVLLLGSEILKTCSYGMFNVLEIAKLHHARLLFTSTAEVYGQPERFPQDESYYGNVNPLGPRSSYEEGKRFAEATLATYVRSHGLDARVVRIFNTYGPGMSLEDFRVIPQFLKSVLAGSPLRIYGDGSQTRTHLFVDDLVNGLQLVMDVGARGEAYNIGSERQTTVRELAELLIDITRHGAGIAYEPHFIEDHSHRRPSVEKVKTLGWSQTIQIENGLEQMVQHYAVPIALEKSDEEPVAEPEGLVSLEKILT